MRGSREPRALLDEIGRAPVPVPRAAFVRDLEARLIALNAVAADGDLMPAPELLVEVGAEVRPRHGAGLASVVASMLVFAAVLTVGHLRASPDGVSSPGGELATAPAEWYGAVPEPAASAPAVPGPVVGNGTSPLDLSPPPPEALADNAPRPEGHAGDPIAGSFSALAAAADADTDAAGSADAPATPTDADLGLVATATAGRSVVRWRQLEEGDFVAYQLWRSFDSERRTSLFPDGVLIREIEDVEVTSYEEPWSRSAGGVRYRLVVLLRDGSVLTDTVAAVADTLRP